MSEHRLIGWCIDCGHETSNLPNKCAFPDTNAFCPEYNQRKLKNVLSPNARRMWRTVQEAASHAPQWAKDQIKEVK